MRPVRVSTFHDRYCRGRMHAARRPKAGLHNVRTKNSSSSSPERDSVLGLNLNGLANGEPVASRER